MSHIPYSHQNIDDDDIAAVTAVLRSEYLTQGPMVAQFEETFARRVGARHAVAMANATAALHVACLALGVTAGSRVWTSPNSFLASANCVLYCGGDIDFVDIDPVTRNMSVAALRAKLERAAGRGELPQVVIPVDFAGLPCDLREMRELADKYGFALLEDASHATGASYQGQPVGSDYADATAFSFHAVKIVTTPPAAAPLCSTRCAARALAPTFTTSRSTPSRTMLRSGSSAVTSQPPSATTRAQLPCRCSRR